MDHVCGSLYQQALTTPIGPEMPASSLEGTTAFAVARERELAPELKHWRADKWQPCPSSLPMRHLRASGMGPVRTLQFPEGSWRIAG